MLVEVLLVIFALFHFKNLITQLSNCQELAQVGPIQPYMGLLSHHGHPLGYKYPTITGVAPQ